MNILRKQLFRLRNFLEYRRELGLKVAIAIARRNFTSSGLYELKVRGIRTPVFCRPLHSDVLVLRQVVGRRESDVLPASVQPRLIIDGGANVGYSSLIFANRYPQAKIIAVEPEARNCEMFRKNCADYPNICLVEGAIWHLSTRLKLNTDVESDSFQVQDANDGAVQAYTIAELIEMSGEDRVDLLKLDIEGAEIEVLSQSTANWINRVDVLLVELHERIRPGCEAALDRLLSTVAHERSRAGEYDLVQLAARAAV